MSCTCNVNPQEVLNLDLSSLTVRLLSLSFLLENIALSASSSGGAVPWVFIRTTWKTVKSKKGTTYRDTEHYGRFTKAHCIIAKQQ